MINSRIRRLGCVLLVSGIAAASAQDRVVGPLPSLAPLVEKVAPAVVNIYVTQFVEPRDQIFGRQGLPPIPEEFLEDGPEERPGAGSGVIVDAERGYVLTNHHVIEDAHEIQVVLIDNRSFDAIVIGSDPESDLAVLQITSEDLTAIPFAPPTDLRVGDYVVAIGNPFDVGQSVTSGIVSAVGRTSPPSYGRSAGYEDFIQTDAAINFGNSGGALINLRGELVGINSAIISRTGDSVGIGFAIPSEMVVSVMGRLIEFGEVRRGLLGVLMETVTPGFAEDYGLAVTSGALVMDVVPNSAADAAGVQINDVIVAVNGLPVSGSNDLRNKIGLMLPSEPVEVQINRAGRVRSINAVLGAKPPEGIVSASGTREAIPRQSALDGIELMAENGRNPGLRVLSIAVNNGAAYRELEPGDLIKAVNQKDVDSVADAIQLANGARNVVLEIEREERARLIRLRP
jgi:Do/DeqQ family serine protease